MAGYSKRPLAAKLGIKAGHRACLLGAPRGYRRVLAAPDDVRFSRALGKDADFVQVFVTRRDELEAGFPHWKRALAKDGMVWVSWPKKASGRTTDLTGDVVRQVGLSNGLVDVKVAAVDETWSGLKFVYRLADR